MIDLDPFFEQLGSASCLWCGAGGASSDLAAVAEFAASKNMSLISVAPDAVAVLWPWLERANVGIMVRLYVEGTVNANVASDMAARARAAFRQGACGAQIFVRVRDLESLVSQMHLIRDDLFFNKFLSIGLDIGDVDVSAWPDIFDGLRKIKADSLLIALTTDKGNKSDFVGRIYGMLDSWCAQWRGDLHFALGGNFIRIDQAWRLTEKMRPDLVARQKFFISM